jgi:exopolysaccharide production protein ExoQ
VLGVAGVHRVFARTWRVLLGACAVSLVVAPGYASRPAVDLAPGWHGVFGHKNALGTVTVLALATFWFEAPSPSRRRWLALTAVLLVGSRSSTALAVTIVLLGLVAWQAALKIVQNRWMRMSLRAATAAFVVLGATAFWVRIDIFASLLGRDPTLSGRTHIWAAVWRAIAERPLLGQGVGGVWRAPIEPTTTIWKEIDFQAFHAHSGYLDLLLQLGVVGTVFFLALIGSTAVGLHRRGGTAGRWGLVLLFVLCLNAASETGPFLSEGFVVLTVLSAAAAQKPPVRRRGYRSLAPPGGTPAAARLASSSA